MSTTHKRAIEGDTLETTVSTGHTVAAAVKFVIHKLAFTNYHDGADAVISVYLVPSGGTAEDKYKVASDQDVFNDETWTCHAAEGQTLDAGGTIQYISNVGSAVTAVCSGVEITV